MKTKLGWIETLVGDLRFALRYFGRNKLTVAIIVSVFALGIGANTMAVTVMQSQFQRPAPGLPKDDAHVRLWGEVRSTSTARWRWRGFTGAELTELAAQRETFTDVAGWVAHDVVLNISDSIGPRGVRAQFVTPNYFAALGISVVGNGFNTTTGDADMSAVMSFRMAERLYGTATQAVGQRVLVNDVPVRVVGIGPRTFQGALRNMDAGQTALWIPVGSRAEIAKVPAHWVVESPVLDAFARLAPRVSQEKAATLVQVVLTRTLPDSAARVGMARAAQVFSLHDMEPGDDTEDMLLLFGLLSVVGVLLLLVTCTNISSLMVAAAVARRHEIAVRLSLGASRSRIVRQLLTETTLLAISGGIAGLLVCVAILRWMSAQYGSVDGNIVVPDATTLAITIAIAVGTGAIFGISPALHATRGSVATALQDTAIGASRKSRLQRGFVVAQIAFSQPLLVTLGVSLALMAAEHTPLRKEVSERVTRVTFRPLWSTGTPDQRVGAVDSVIPRIAAHPEITGVVHDASKVTRRSFVTLTADSAASVEKTPIVVHGVTPGWFAVIGVPIVLGRDVSLADTAASQWPVVIGSDLARTLWAGANPIGKTLLSHGRDSVELTVVGVYDGAYATTSDDQTRAAYTAHGGEWRREALLVRTRGIAVPFFPELRRLIRDNAPGLPVSRMVTLAQQDESDRRESMAIGAVMAGSGAMALLLASLGLYGVIALAVRQRTREIGIRIAIGAKPASVARMFLASGIRMAAFALLIGMPLCLAFLTMFRLNPELELWKVNPWMIGATVATALLGVAAAATWIPARRASLVNPASTLRVE